MGAWGDIYQFWHTYGSDIQNGAVVLSAVAAFAVIRDARLTAKRRGTLDLILHQESDQELVEIRQRFNEVKAGDKRPSTYGQPDHKNTPEAQAVRKILNLHELTAVAIQEGVIDECVFRRWFNQTYVSDYDATKDYITVARSTYQNPAAFKEFEKTAIRWKHDKSWYAEPGWIKRKFDAALAVIRA